MKKLWIILSLASLLAGRSFADSPVTSTPFSTAYLDLPEVAACTNTGLLTEALANILGDPAFPLDVKMAMINALSWDIDGKNNTEVYLNTIADSRDIYDDLFHSEWQPHDYLVIGYLMLMDDYFNEARALPWLDKARELMPDSLTVGIIHAIGYAQHYMQDQRQWNQVWQACADVLGDKSLDPDMREAAIDIIVDYLILYK